MTKHASVGAAALPVASERRMGFYVSLWGANATTRDGQCMGNARSSRLPRTIRHSQKPRACPRLLVWMRGIGRVVRTPPLAAPPLPPPPSPLGVGVGSPLGTLPHSVRRERCWPTSGPSTSSSTTQRGAGGMEWEAVASWPRTHGHAGYRLPATRAHVYRDGYGGSGAASRAVLLGSVWGYAGLSVSGGQPPVGWATGAGVELPTT
jgi:hypothetical protein